jgi:hypothetical protein
MSTLGLISERRPLRRRLLGFDDAVEIWKRHYFFSESPRHIAQAFGVNERRIHQILRERRQLGSRLVALGKNPLGGTGCKQTH